MAIDPGDLERVAGHQSRSYRTTASDERYTNAPSVRSQLVEQAVPEFTTTTGLEGLSAAMGNFYNMARNGLSDVASAAAIMHERDKAKAADESKLAGKADLLHGKPKDPTKEDDLIYQQSYAGAAAERDAPGHWMDAEAYITEQVEKNGMKPEAAFDQFIKTQFGDGTGDDVYDVMTLDSLNTKFGAWNYDHNKDVIAVQKAKGVETMMSAITTKVKDGTFTASDITTSITAFRALNSGSPEAFENAPKLVANSILAARDGTMGTAMKLTTLLDQKGGGLDGQSFAESWPESALQIKTALREDYENGLSLEGVAVFEDLKAQVNGFDPTSYKNEDGTLNMREAYTALMNISNEAGAQAARYGSPSEWEKIVNAIDKSPVVKSFQNSMYFESVMNGSETMPDISTLKNAQKDYFAMQGIDPLKNPNAAAQAVSRTGVINDDLKKQMSTGLISFGNPNLQMISYTFMNELAGSDKGRAFALSMMDESAKDVFQQVEDAMLTGGDLATVMEEVKKNQGKYEALKGKSLNQIFGTTSADADFKAGIQSTVADALGTGGFGRVMGSALTDKSWSDLETPTIDISFENAVQTRFKSLLVSRGTSNPEKAMKDAVEQLLPNALLVPDGSSRLTVRMGDGKPMEGLKFGIDVPVEGSSKTVNTLQVYKDDVAALKKALPQMVAEDDEVHLEPDPNGMFQIINDRTGPLVIGEDEEVTFETSPEFEYHYDDAQHITVKNPMIRTNTKGIEAFDAKFGEVVGARQNGRIVRVDTKLGYSLLYYVPGPGDDFKTDDEIISDKEKAQ